MAKDFLKIAGNVHLAYYVEAADKLGIDYDIVIRSLIARFWTDKKHWFIINTAVPINNVPSTTIAKRKNLTFQILKDAGVPVAEQIAAGSAEEAIEFYNKYKKIVVKPTQNLGGNGVSILPDDIDEVKNAFDLAESKDLSKSSKHVLVEEFIEGYNYRLLVLDDKIIGAVFRKPASIVGNSKNTIMELIEKKNVERKKAILKKIPVDNEVDERLKELGMTYDTILEKGQEVILRRNANQSTGGTTEECMEKVHPHYKEMAVAATKAIGLKLGGVDLITPDISDPNAKGVINEVNYNPGLRVHYRADKGDVVDVAVPIQEYIRDNY